jgi:peptide/nickel transport system ATP-binding protein
MTVAEGVAATPRIAVDGLTVRTSKSKAAVVDNVSLEVAKGEIIGIVGESGSGKTTLGLAMIGYVRRGLAISAGRVRFDGRDLLALSDAELRGLRGTSLAYVPQDPATALNPALKVGSQLREVLTAHGNSREEANRWVDEVLTEVGLDSVTRVLESYPHQLSGGQQQRVSLALAFANRPRLIVLDEPTTGLDVSTQQTVLDTVVRLSESYEATAIYVSHDIAAIDKLADRVVVLYAGEVVEVGHADEVLRTPVHPYTRGLLRAVPSAAKSRRLIGMDGTPPRPGHRGAGCHFAPRCPVRVDRCMVESPPLVAMRDGHLGRCLLLEQGASSTEAAFPVVALAEGHAASPVVDAPLLSVDRLSASYGATQVVHEISLDLSANTCLAVVGESGSGKTTLARCISGLHVGMSGTLSYQGSALPAGIAQRDRDTLREIQYIFQNPYGSLNPHRTVGGLISQPLEHFGNLPREAWDAAVFEAIESVSLAPDIAERYPDELSGGERQRVAIARALVVSPRLLICDEVTSALDVSVQAAVVELLQRLQVERGLGLIFITHNLPLVRSVAQNVIVMKAGQIVERGPVGQVLTEPEHEYTRSLMAHVAELRSDG